MGVVSNYDRMDRFIKEFEEDILKVYEVKGIPAISRQTLGIEDGRFVRIFITLKGDSARASVDATLHAPIFYDAEICDVDNLELLVEALEAYEDGERDALAARMRKAELL